jgi:FkbM family methyltransferase
MTFALSHESVLRLKSIVYGRRGEPYDVGGRRLRFAPGTRPVRMRYRTSPNDNVRYDALQAELLSKGLREGDTAIDIGAHAGQYALIMAAMCGPRGRVIAFEPDPHARRLLAHNIALNPGVTPPVVEALAVSDAPGEAVLYSRGGDSRSSLARTGIGEAAAATAETLTVPVVALDGYIADRRLSEPRWVKIDTEGAEIRILKGAPRLLAGPAGIVCELHPYAWAEFGSSFDELRAVVAAGGRWMRYLDEAAEIAGEPRYGTVLLEPRR